MGWVTEKLRSPEWWYFSGGFLALSGLVMIFFGHRAVGVGLMVPFGLENALLILGGIPFLLYSNWKLRRKAKES